MTVRDERTPPDVDRLTRSMLLLHGAHEDDDHPLSDDPGTGSWSKAPDFATDPKRAAAVREATERDKQRYLNAGMTPVDCRFCHATVAVKKLGPEYTAVQWNSAASQRCAVFTEARASGNPNSRNRSCPKLSDSIDHAIAEGCLEGVSTAPSPGDG